MNNKTNNNLTGWDIVVITSMALGVFCVATYIISNLIW